MDRYGAGAQAKDTGGPPLGCAGSRAHKSCTGLTGATRIPRPTGGSRH
jgi:hypothetical protein